MTGQRQKFITRTIRLVSPVQVDTALSLLPNLPIDPDRPLVLSIGEEVKARKLDQNALMWVGPLADIANQAYYQGRRYSDVLWHETFKRLYLPEEYDPELCKKEDYVKWDFDRDGVRVCVGSTTELTVKGFALYLEQVYADGASMGVIFHANPNDAKRVA